MEDIRSRIKHVPGHPVSSSNLFPRTSVSTSTNQSIAVFLGTMAETSLN